MHRAEDGALHFWRTKRKIFRIHSHNLFIGLTVDGKHVWQQEEEQKGDSSAVLMIQEQLFIFELFKDIQDAILLILHCRTMMFFEQVLPAYLPYWMCVQSSFYHQLWINTWRSKFEQETDSILAAC